MAEERKPEIAGETVVNAAPPDGSGSLGPGCHSFDPVTGKRVIEHAAAGLVGKPYDSRRPNRGMMMRKDRMPELEEGSLAWMADAYCKGRTKEWLFDGPPRGNAESKFIYDESNGTYREIMSTYKRKKAKAIGLCQTQCPVREECLAYSMTLTANQKGSWGVWGGHTWAEIEHMKRRNKNG